MTLFAMFDIIHPFERLLVAVLQEKADNSMPGKWLVLILVLVLGTIGGATLLDGKASSQRPEETMSLPSCTAGMTPGDGFVFTQSCRLDPGETVRFNPGLSFIVEHSGSVTFVDGVGKEWTFSECATSGASLKGTLIGPATVLPNQSEIDKFEPCLKSVGYHFAVDSQALRCFIGGLYTQELFFYLYSKF